MSKFSLQVVVLAAITVAVLNPLTTIATAQDASPQADTPVLVTADDAETSEKDHVETIRGFIEESGAIGYVILGLLVVGIVLVLDQLRVHWLEILRGKSIYGVSTRSINIDDIQDLITKAHGSRIAVLFSESISLFEDTHEHAALVSEADLFREKEESRFHNFESRMSFISDTAGGLGLLGTVLGIYQAFKVKGGGMDDQALLAAMGLALGTTFLGILVSVIVNWMSTEMGVAANKRILAALDRADALKETLVRAKSNQAA